MAVCCFQSGARSWNRLSFQCLARNEQRGLLDAREPEANPRIPESGVGSVGMLKGRLMPGARSKRCRQARPLTGMGRLAERERPGYGCAHQCRTRSLSARSAHPSLSRAASPAPLARRNVGLDMQFGVSMAGRSDSSRGEEQGLTLRGFFSRSTSVTARSSRGRLGAV
jgi:hypothetical protein